jgi:hypothetical protein
LFPRTGSDAAALLRDVLLAFGPIVDLTPDELAFFAARFWQILTSFKVSGGENFVLNAGTSAHPMANNLRTLALDGARPVLLQYADPFQSLLFPGRAV